MGIQSGFVGYSFAGRCYFEGEFGHDRTGLLDSEAGTSNPNFEWENAKVQSHAWM